MAHDTHGHAPLGGDMDDPDPGAVTYIGVVGSLVTIALIFAVAALYHTVDNAEFERKVLNTTNTELAALQNEQRAALAAPARWVDQERGVARIDIQRASELAIRDLNAGKASAPPAPAANVPR
ncbi:MAG: hypothetical protein HRU75_13960 [Planctomycetia bacterium]|nr:MAG: hypothetical protein HRU75_13960 [Planctomycetia bacterium]